MAADYKALGLKCGLELHQRLATATKLFCSCPAIMLPQQDMEQEVLRYQRAVAGELGAIDTASEFESLKKRAFVYHVHHSSNCLVELDEEPPHQLNREALEIAMSFAAAMSMHIMDEIQPMRKMVVDGSDPSAFQRTMAVAFDGSITVNGKTIGIPGLYLEEESSAIINSDGQRTAYGLERLGIPLVEITTAPDIDSPAQAKDVALYIGAMMRMSGKVQRGIGSVRQDINVSVKDGARVEIKGFQEIDQVDTLIENEVTRQQKLLEVKERLRVSRAKVHQPVEVTNVFERTQVKVIANNIANGAVFGFRLEGFSGVPGTEINPDRRVGSEISDYAKMAGVNGIIHSDELSHYNFNDDEINAVKRLLTIHQKDAFILVAGERQKAVRAAELAKQRAELLLSSIPNETRVAIPGSMATKFIRPLPGGARMYPETDATPVLISAQMLEAATLAAPNPEKQIENLKKLIANDELVHQLIFSPRLQLFIKIVKQTGADPEFVANILIQKFVQFRRDGIDVNTIKEERIIEIFSGYKSGRVTKVAVEEVIKALAAKDRPVEEIIKQMDLKRITGEELRALVNRESAADQSLDKIRTSIMAKYRKNVDGAELNAMLAPK